ncbi:beta-ketoacyl synthase N-terminal-like domain-containing protein [Flexivirga oryzae]|uniref:3-oxoacyl-(Acyl-carrier-protein) synthase/NAD(P)-dependent dehydrogenase (Short-subunit alcohol dehydrogenase family)/acyl carrier protein n=1 Tax=Flexivirga oryzae TaxID=1794944 RepID=A0A839N678_9MICO|nr:beta-ketoacyl synthase N-terminal-like domain-containing protein [Flexivirga oryzae]MBB2893250.1 3-oxoacyl-(acyl-carrier-protein) synthase/NAD(P)-dependent dehydrogenase (short-subunit alcohol dehydrogenase family)/acyl carrier protein [Flexivirga oryzae]
MELAQYLYSQITSGQLDEAEGRRYIGQVLPSDIAVVGMSCEYTGADSVFGFEEMLRSGRNGFRSFPESRKQYFPRDHRYLVDAARVSGRDAEELFQAMCGQPGAYLDDVDQFEPGFFDIAENEATYIDPMHRLVLKHLHLAIEHSGMTREEIVGSRTAIYVGKDRSIAGSYASEIEADSDLVNPGTWEGILASRLNYLYDLQGGSLVVDTACSSSLVALHIAKKMLRDNEIDIALVGGIALGMAPRQGEVFGDYASVETARDHLKVFDRASSGTIFGEGVGFVMLRRLPDAVSRRDKVYSLVRATGINSDGRSNGLTAPNPKAQTNLILDTYSAAAISPETIDYVDAHGTGTKLGDPIEIRGLTDAFRTGGVASYSTCALSSLKENIGHTVGAAGVGGLIKMSLALNSRMIYPAGGFEVPNDFIKFIDTPFYVPNQLSHWESRDHPRRGAISSFGFSGTNGHAVLEEYPADRRDPQTGTEFPFLLSSPTGAQLMQVIDGFLSHEELIRENLLADIAYTLVCRRRRYASSVGFTASSHEEFFASLRTARAALAAGQAADGIFLGDGTADGPASRSTELLRARIAQHPELFSLQERLELEAAEGDGFLGEGDFGDARVCGLPGHVFDTRRYWGTVKKYNVYQADNALSGTPVDGQLLTSRLLSTPSTDLYTMQLDLDRWFLTNHRIAGLPTLSGTAYTQLAAELAQLHFGTPRYELTKMMFQNLIQVTEARTVLVQATKSAKGQDRGLEVEVFSQTDDAEAPFITHGSFRLAPLSDDRIDIGPGPADPGPDAVASNWSGNDEEDSGGMRFAGRWDVRKNEMVLDALTPSDHVMRFTLAPEFREDLTDFHISPALLDLVAGVVSWERSTATGRTYLPLSYGALRFTGLPFTPTVRSRTKLHYDVASDPLVAVADVWIYDDQGRLVVQLERYAMRAFTGSATSHTTTFHEVCLEPIESPAECELPASVAVVDSAGRLGDFTGLPQWQRIGADEVAGLPDKLDALVHVSPAMDGGDVAAFEKALRDVLTVAKAAPRALRAGGRLVFLTRDGLATGTGSADPFAYAVSAAARVIQLENPRLTTVAIADPELDLQRAVRLASAEALAGRKVLVGADGLLGEVVRTRRGALPDRQLPENATVLVTGAFGGVGTQYLTALWEHYRASVVVLGRRDATDLLDSDDADDRARGEQIGRLVDDGMSLRFVRCDLSDDAAVRETIRSLREELVFDAVVHLAGVPEDGMLFRKEWEDLRAIVAPKAAAAAVLLEELAGQRPQFLAASSMTTLAGAPGQFGYTFANAYLEGLARATDGAGVVRWPGWKETGMATRFGVDSATDDAFLLRALPTDEAAAYVRETLGRSFVDVVAGEFTASAHETLSPWMGFEASSAEPAPSTESSGTATAAGVDTESAEQNGLVIRSFDELKITGADRELSDIEKLVAVLFASVLERDEIDVRASFTDLGGDSLKAFSIYTPLVEQLDVDLEVADIFIHSTVLELSAHVREMQEG